jgi:hypothetical protein
MRMDPRVEQIPIANAQKRLFCEKVCGRPHSIRGAEEERKVRFCVSFNMEIAG